MPHLYHVTLEKAGVIHCAVQGSFTGPRKVEVVVSHGKLLALYRIAEDGNLTEIFKDEVFGLVRRIQAFRMTGAQKDYLGVTSDSGRIAILDWDPKNNKFVPVHRETYGKTGVRRGVPGEYLAVDPKGRAVMIGAAERQKFVYILTRDASGRLAISSPLEAHKRHQVCFDLVSLNVGFEHPVFASLEINCEVADAPVPVSKPMGRDPTMHVAFWELDLGLNHVVKKCSLPVHRSAHCLIPVPAGAEFSEGPGGVLVCCENFIAFRKPDHPEVSCAYPRRLDDQNRGLLICCWTAHRMKDFYFILVQTEHGDIYRVEVISEGPTVSQIVVRYFDSLPTARALCILQSGHLFAASENGDHSVYQFTSVGGEETKYVVTSDHPQGTQAIVPFKPRRLRNLIQMSTLRSMGPLTDLKVIDCIGDTQSPQIYALTGAGPRGCLDVLRLGLQVDQMAASELPGYPTGLWTLPERYEDELHRYVLLAFASATLVLRVSDTIEEQTDSLFVTGRTTLHAAAMVDGSHLQVTDEGWHLLQPLTAGGRASAERGSGADEVVDRKVIEWKVRGGKRVVAAASNASQLLVCLSGGTVIYFELQTGGARLLEEKASHEMGCDLTAAAIAPTPAGVLRGTFAVLAGVEGSVRVFSLDKLLFKPVASHPLPRDSHAQSLAVSYLPFSQMQSEEGHFGSILSIGLNTGVLIRLSMDANTGMVHQHQRRQKFLGALPVKLVPVTVTVPATTKSDGTAEVSMIQGCLAISSKTWLAYAHKGLFRLAPLLYESLTLAASLNSIHCASGLVAVAGNVLHIVSVRIDAQDKIFSSTRIPLDFTPRKVTVFPPPPTAQERQEAKLQNMPIMLLPPRAQRPWHLAVIEGDHNAFDLGTRREITEALKNVHLEGEDTVADAATIEGEEEGGTEEPDVTQVDTIHAGDAKWGGALRLINPASPPEVVQSVAFGPDECPVSITVCQFVEYPQHPALVVGTITGLDLKTRRSQGGHIRVYVYDDDGRLVEHHATPVEDVPMALSPWQGQLLASIGHRLRVYALGKKRLLKRCEYKNLPVGVNWLRTSGDRIFAGDIRDGFHVLRYNQADNTMRVIGMNPVPRWLVSGEILDHHTLIGSDKFDNAFVLRLPPTAIKQADLYDTTGLQMRGDSAYITGQVAKMTRLCEFHIGDLATALQKCVLVPGGSEIIIFGTVSGGVGCFLPLPTLKETELLQHLEMLLRNEDVSLVGRDHIFFRSAYFPVKGVIDGDLLELYPYLPAERQAWIAQQVDKTPADVLKLLDDLRSRIL